MGVKILENFIDPKLQQLVMLPSSQGVARGFCEKNVILLYIHASSCRDLWKGVKYIYKARRYISLHTKVKLI